MTYIWFTHAHVSKQGEMIPVYEFKVLFEMSHYMCLGVVHNNPSFKYQLSHKAAAISVFYILLRNQITCIKKSIYPVSKV
ncbi:hypothetical protein Nmel_009092 [Mimus melanotis]